jgi:Na+-transporting NADH:ubiquinone oxidoreductase subunit A
VLEFGTQSYRVLAEEGSEVRAGTPVLASKLVPGLQICAPAAGRLKEIRRGARRVITHLVFEVSGTASIDLPKHAPADVAKLSREAVERILLGTGLWALMRTRPLDALATPGEVPQAIVVVATESGPALPGPTELLDVGDKAYLQAAVTALKTLTTGPVLLTVPEGTSHPALQGLTGCETHGFSGPHPSGDPAVQINLTTPPAGGRKVWYLRAWDAVLFGKVLLDGAYPTQRVYAAVGAGLKQPRLVRTTAGAPISYIAGATVDGPVRWIRGSVLTGEKVDPAEFMGSRGRSVHVVAEVVERSLMGWTTPQTGLFSYHRAYLTGFLGAAAKRFDLRPGRYGGERPIIPSARYDGVVATPDIFPEQLFRSISAGDLEESLKLGLLDISAEEAALLTYICPSKVEYDVLLQQGLDQYVRES